jgi:hypothetical protein
VSEGWLIDALEYLGSNPVFLGVVWVTATALAVFKFVYTHRSKVYLPFKIRKRARLYQELIMVRNNVSVNKTEFDLLFMQLKFHDIYQRKIISLISLAIYNIIAYSILKDGSILFLAFISLAWIWDDTGALKRSRVVFARSFNFFCNPHEMRLYYLDCLKEMKR